jgi:hypothetical protein
MISLLVIIMPHNLNVRMVWFYQIEQNAVLSDREETSIYQ